MIRQNVDLSKYTTFGVKALAKSFSSFDSIDSLLEILDNHTESNLFILGGGSNILFTKAYDGLVLRNEIKGIDTLSQDEETALVRAGAGEVWHDFVMQCIELGYAGVENLSLIPGSVGASPIQNIGAYGVEIQDVFDSLRAFHISTGEIHTFSHSDCSFGYRDSVFKTTCKSQYIILDVTFRLSKKPKLNTSYGAIEQELEKMGAYHPSIRDVSNAVISIRRSKLPDPSELGNAGSFFKNPVVTNDVAETILAAFPKAPVYKVDDAHKKLAAGWLIEQAGWKGYRHKNCGVHSKQALVIVNYGDATGDDIFDLSEQIIGDIYSKFNIQLEREVNIL